MGEFTVRSIVLVALAACGLTACIIGPKQDDPTPSSALPDSAGAEADSSTGGLDGAALDDETGKVSDSAATPADTLSPGADTGASVDAAPDAGCAADADACGDGASDGASDGVSDGTSDDAVSDAMDGG